MPPIDDIVLKIRKQFFARQFNVGEFDNEAVKECILNALEDYSKYKSRKNRREDITLTAGEYYIDLPADFMQANMQQIMYVVTGNSGYGYSWNNANYRGRTSLSVFDSQLGATQYPPLSIYYGTTLNTPEGLIASGNISAYNSFTLTTGDLGLYQLAVTSPISDTVTRTLVYDAFHVIDEEKNTVPANDQGIILNLAISQLLVTLATDLLSKPNSIKNYNVANQYVEISKDYRKSALSKLRRYGFTG